MPANKPPPLLRTALEIWKREEKEKQLIIFTQPRFCLDNEGKHTKKIVLIHQATITRCGSDSYFCWLQIIKSPFSDRMLVLKVFMLRLCILRRNEMRLWNFYWSLSAYQSFIVSLLFSIEFRKFIITSKSFIVFERCSNLLLDSKERGKKDKKRSEWKRVCQFWLKLIIKFAFVLNPITLNSRLPVMKFSDFHDFRK